MASRFLLPQLRNLHTPATSSLRFPTAALSSKCSALTLLHSHRLYSTGSVEAPDYLDDAERKIFGLLKDSLQPSKLEVQDISGGCGSMYALDIVSEQFKGMTTIKQHRLVNKVLGEEIKKWHGVQLKTKAP